MRANHLKKAEIFAFLAALFLVWAFISDQQRREIPPILILSEANADYRFTFGSAELTDTFRTSLSQRVVPLLDSLSKECDCTVIEVVGHTDAVPWGGDLPSTLDHLLAIGYWSEDFSGITAGSNIDLGMMRAVAVVAELRRSQRAGWLGRIGVFLPYSAGQLILPPGDEIAPAGDPTVPDPARRRIEIRLRRRVGGSP